MAAGDVTRQAVDNIIPIEISRDMAHGPMGMEIAAVPAGYARSFLSAMLEGMKAKSYDR